VPWPPSERDHKSHLIRHKKTLATAHLASPQRMSIFHGGQPSREVHGSTDVRCQTDSGVALQWQHSIYSFANSQSISIRGRSDCKQQLVDCGSVELIEGLKMRGNRRSLTYKCHCSLSVSALSVTVSPQSLPSAAAWLCNSNLS
jgi:hypothetical protein